MKIHSFMDPKQQTNIYLLVADDGKTGILVDPAEIDGQMIKTIERKRIDLRYVLITHAHPGHIAALGKLLKIYSPECYSYLGRCNGIKTVKVWPDDEFEFGGTPFRALHVPGHSLDSICWLSDNVVFTGDTIMSGSIAHTNTLIEKELLSVNIRQKILTLPYNTIILPGHGCPSKVGIESMCNQDMLEAEASMV